MSRINDKHIAKKENQANYRRCEVERAQKNQNTLNFHQANEQTKLNEVQEP